MSKELCEARNNEDGLMPNGDYCQTCCEHGDQDTHFCLICGEERDPSDGDEDYGQGR